MNRQRQVIELLKDKLRVNILDSSLPNALILATNHSPTIESKPFLCTNKHLFIRKLPSIRNISFTAYMRFIGIIKRNKPLLTKAFQLTQYLNFIVINKWIRGAFYSLSNAFISAAECRPSNTFKKLRKASLPTGWRPSERWDSHCALAKEIRCRLACTAAIMADSSSDLLIEGLRPRPGFVTKPLIPSVLYRPSQLLTLTWHMPTIWPTSFDLRPSAFNKMDWQRIRKAWLLLDFKLVSNSFRCSSLRSGLLTRPMKRK